MAHLDHQVLIDHLKDIHVQPGQRYQHYKTKGIYTVKEIVFLEATDEPAIAYYDPQVPELVWIRAHRDFVAQVDGQQRFSLLS